MAIIKNKDKRTGITYVYESESYWDKEKQQPRARRHLIGKLDEATGEIIPTDGRGRKRKASGEKAASKTELGNENSLQKELMEKEEQIKALQEENTALKESHQRLLEKLSALLEDYQR